MGRAEQEEEREVLASIFPDEITDIDETHFRVAIALDLDEQDDGEEDEVKPTILLTVSYPTAYPDVAPDLELSHPPGGVKPAHLDLSTDKSALLEALAPMIEESLGMAMVFTLVTSLKDAAEQLVAERRTAAEQAHEAELRAEEDKENAKFHGEKVTRESFLRWREAFVRERADDERRRLEEAEAAAKKGARAAAALGDKLTGKQLWERGLAGKGWEEDEGDALTLVERERDRDDGDAVTLVEKDVAGLTVGK